MSVDIGELNEQTLSLKGFQKRLKSLGRSSQSTTPAACLPLGEQLEARVPARWPAARRMQSHPQAPASLVPYLTRRAAHWREGAAGQLDRRFVNLTLIVNHGLEFDGPRHEAQGRYSLLEQT